MTRLLPLVLAPLQGLSFSKNIIIQRGMSGGVFLGIAGEPDPLSD